MEALLRQQAAQAAWFAPGDSVSREDGWRRGVSRTLVAEMFLVKTLVSRPHANIVSESS